MEILNEGRYLSFNLIIDNTLYVTHLIILNNKILSLRLLESDGYTRIYYGEPFDTNFDNYKLQISAFISIGEALDIFLKAYDYVIDYFNLEK